RRSLVAEVERVGAASTVDIAGERACVLDEEGVVAGAAGEAADAAEVRRVQAVGQRAAVGAGDVEAGGACRADQCRADAVAHDRVVARGRLYREGTAAGPAHGGGDAVAAA